MNESVAVESLFSSEMVSRFLCGQNDVQRRAVNACRSVKFDASRGAIVLECPNALLGSMIESMREDWDAIAASIGVQIQIVIVGKGKHYW